MAKFQYRMQSILDIKLKIEEQEKMQFAEAKNRLDEEEEKLQVFISRKEQYEEEARRLLQTTLDIPKIEEAQNAGMRMDEYIAIQKQEVKKAQKALEQARLRLQEVMVERKSHEKLKENAFDEFMQELSSAESKEVDELTSYTYGQKQLSQGR